MKLLITILSITLSGCMVHRAGDEAWTYAEPGQPIYMKSHNYYPMYRSENHEHHHGYSRYRAYGKR